MGVYKVWIAVLTVLLHHSDAAVTLTVSPKEFTDKVSLVFKCTTPDFTKTITFRKQAQNQGGCAFGSCGSMQTGYTISQSAPTDTFLTIDESNCTRDAGTWDCVYDLTISNTLTLQCISNGDNGKPEWKVIVGVTVPVSLLIICLSAGGLLIYKLTVNPLICSQAIEFCVGKEVTMSPCISNGNHDHKEIESVSWYLIKNNRRQIIPSDEPRYIWGILENPFLTIKDLKKEDEGQYFCHLKFKANSREQHKFELVFIDEEIVQIEGEKMTMPSKQLINLYKNKTVDIVNWYHTRENQTIPIRTNEERYTGGKSEDPHLTINYLTKEDEGQYMCTLKFKDSLTAQFKLRLIVVSEKIVKRFGEKVTLLHGKLLGQQYNKIISKVEWEFVKQQQTKPIPTSENRYSGGTKTEPCLTISSFEPDDEGLYLCTLTYSDSSKAQYKVQLTARNSTVLDV